MDRVVYILGAGFSAPLGLPLMSNFLHKSKDMYERNRDTYKHFIPVFEEMDRRIAKSAIYFSTDVFNIEEILSILEIGQYIDGKNNMRQQFEDYIKQVVEYHTPQCPESPRQGWDTYWLNEIFYDLPQDDPPLWSYYGSFVGSLFNLSFKLVPEENRVLAYSGDGEAGENTHYSIITLNYDLILENLCNYINKHYCAESKLSFVKDSEAELRNTHKPVLAKLHGSVDATIIPPTWSKKAIDSKILDAWKLAHQVLVDANYIRIVGYSLPVTDTYVRYLLKSAVISAFNLKQIDVICLDDDGSVQGKYDEFVKFKHYRFANSNVVDYLFQNWSTITDVWSSGEGGSAANMNQLVHAHDMFMQ